MSEPNYKVDEETAKEEFDRFCEEMDIDNDESSMEEDDINAYRQIKNTIIRAIRKGRLIINDDGEPVYTPISVDTGPITFHEPNGANYFEMDRKKKNQNVAKSFAIMAAMTKQEPKTFANMKQRDLKVCQAVMTVFLG